MGWGPGYTSLTLNETQKDRNEAAEGKRRRKQFGWAALAQWDAGRRLRKPLDILKEADAGRLAPLLRLKYERMSASPFGFFRGAAPVMASDLALTGNSGIVTQLCGDAHVQNLGAYTGPDGRLIFDINDFDETIRGPFEWDVKRMVTSILLAGVVARAKSSGCRKAGEVCLFSYCDLVHRLSRLPVLEVARYQVHRLTSVAPISKILQKAERATPLRSLEQLTEKSRDGRRFISRPPLLRRVTGAERAMVLASLPLYTKSLLPERQHFFTQFRPVDVASKVVGTGSVGLRDYCIYMEGNGSDDPLFLQIKQEVRSVYTRYLPRTALPPASNEGERVAAGQRAMQLQSDPLLGWTRLDGQDYLVRQLNDHKAAIDITRVNVSELCEYAEVCGEMLARGHMRAGDGRVIAAYIRSGKRFSEAILDFAEAYAAQTSEDWKALVRTQKQR